MNKTPNSLGLALIILAVVSVGCGNGSHTHDGLGPHTHEKGESTAIAISSGEHDGDGGEHNRSGGEHEGEEGEESDALFGRGQTYDAVRNGARLILAYDATANAFRGTVENATDKPLKAVRVEVHLSNGTELGPTTPVDLDPSQQEKVELKATDAGFEGWSAHAEVGTGEHGHGEEDQEDGGAHR